MFSGKKPYPYLAQQKDALIEASNTDLQHDLAKLIKYAAQKTEHKWENSHQLASSYEDVHAFLYYAAHIIIELNSRSKSLDFDHMVDQQKLLSTEATKKLKKQEAQQCAFFYENFLNWLQKHNYYIEKLKEKFPKYDDLLFLYKEASFTKETEELRFRIIFQNKKLISLKESEKKLEKRYFITHKRILSKLEEYGIQNPGNTPYVEVVEKLERKIQKINEEIKTLSISNIEPMTITNFHKAQTNLLKKIDKFSKITRNPEIEIKKIHPLRETLEKSFETIPKLIDADIALLNIRKKLIIKKGTINNKTLKSYKTLPPLSYFEKVATTPKNTIERFINFFLTKKYKEQAQLKIFKLNENKSQLLEYNEQLKINNQSLIQTYKKINEINKILESKEYITYQKMQKEFPCLEKQSEFIELKELLDDVVGETPTLMEKKSLVKKIKTKVEKEEIIEPQDDESLQFTMTM